MGLGGSWPENLINIPAGDAQVGIYQVNSRTGWLESTAEGWSGGREECL